MVEKNKNSNSQFETDLRATKVESSILQHDESLHNAVNGLVEKERIGKEATHLKAWYDLAHEGASNHEQAAEKLVEENMKTDKELGATAIQALTNHREAIEEFTDIAAKREEHSRNHYLQNQEAYHELAVQEAEADGVQINVSQPHEEAQVIEVNFQKK